MNGSPNSNKKFKKIPKTKSQRVRDSKSQKVKAAEGQSSKEPKGQRVKDSESQRLQDSELQRTKAPKDEKKTVKSVQTEGVLVEKKQSVKKFPSVSHIFFRSLSITGQYFARLARLDYFLTVFTVLTILLICFIAFLAYKIERTAVFPYHDTYHVNPAPLYTDSNPPHLSAQAYIVYEVTSRTVIFGKNIHYRFSPASTAKIMTALLSIENYPLQTVLTANHPELIEGSKMNLVNGERITVQNLLYGLLLPSGNDAAHVLADNFPGGLTGFLAAMNQKAKDLDMNNTYYNDPAGYNDDNYTTPFDLARLAAVAIQNSTFAKVVSTKSITVTSTDGKIVHKLDNLNELLNQKEVTGIKTGFTNEAGEVLVTSAIHNGHTYIMVVMKSPDRFGDSLLLLKDVVDHVQLKQY